MRTTTGVFGQPPRNSSWASAQWAARSKSSGRMQSSSRSLTDTHAAHPERAQRAGAAGQRDEVPDARLEHEAERVEEPLHLAVALLVADLDALLLPHRTRQHRQVGDRLLACEPARRVEVEALAHPHGPAAQLRGQRGVDLQLGGGQHRAQPELRGGAGQPGQGQRLRLLGGEAGEPGAVAVDQAHPAARARLGVDGHAGARTGPRCRGRSCAPTPRARWPAGWPSSCRWSGGAAAAAPVGSLAWVDRRPLP